MPKILEYVKLNGIENSIMYMLSENYNTKHIYKARRYNSWLSYFLFTLHIIIQSAIRSFRVRNLRLGRQYEVLFYVPNVKYSRFLNAITESSDFSYLVVSDDRLKSDEISVNSFAYIGIVSSLSMLFKEMFSLWIFSLESGSIKDYKKYYQEILLLIRRDIIISELTKNIQFDKYFSFHPIGITHLIIESLYGGSFKNTYAIRPTTTSMSKEHRYINTKNLFYKNDHELFIYKNIILKNTKLIEGGVLAKVGINEKLHINNNGILFLDTCTSVYPQQAIARRKAISCFINYINASGLSVFYKFHPGIISTEKKQTIGEIQREKYCRIKIIEEEVPWEFVKFVIGFDSTLFYDAIVYRKLIFRFSGLFTMKKNNISEYDNSTIININGNKDFKLISVYNHDNNLAEAMAKKQYEWFIKNYNYPHGLNNIKKILSD